VDAAAHDAGNHAIRRSKPNPSTVGPVVPRRARSKTTRKLSGVITALQRLPLTQPARTPTASAAAMMMSASNVVIGPRGVSRAIAAPEAAAPSKPRRHFETASSIPLPASLPTLVVMDEPPHSLCPSRTQESSGPDQRGL
jgi:hypothetical protein